MESQSREDDRPKRPIPSPLSPDTYLTQDKFQRYDMVQWESRIAELESLTAHAADTLFKDLTLSPKTDSPDVDEADERFMANVRGRWGNEWRGICDALRRNNTFKALPILKTLLGAALHQIILDDNLSWQRLLCKEIGLPKTPEIRALFEKLCFPTTNAEGRKEARIVFADVISKITNERDRSIFNRHAKKVANNIFASLMTHIDPLVIITGVLRRTSISDVWRVNFESNLRKVVIYAQQLKVDVTRSPYEHKFIWPLPGEDALAPLDLMPDLQLWHENDPDGVRIPHRAIVSPETAGSETHEESVSPVGFLEKLVNDRMASH